MNDAATPTQQPNQEELRKYLTTMLFANPQVESERIVSQRMKAMRITADIVPEVDAARVHQQGLQAALSKITEIRDQIWLTPENRVYDSLATLDATTFPQIQEPVKRLETFIRNRSKLDKVSSHPDMNDSFLSVFRHILTAAPQERAEARERALFAFTNRKLRKVGRQTLRQLEQSVPELCSLEEEWIARLKKQKAYWFRRKTSEGVDKEREEGWPAWMWWVLIIGMAVGGLKEFLR